MVDYQVLPDEEEGIIADNRPIKLSPQEKYPHVNKKEAELLGLLDDTMENAILTFVPPLLEEADEPVKSSSLKELFFSLKIPTMTFIGIVIGALGLILLENHIIQLLYPYFSAIAMFVGSIPTQKQKFSDVFMCIEEKVGTTVTDIYGQIDAIAGEVRSSLSFG